METPHHSEEILAELKTLNAQIANQSAFRHNFSIGILYGIGFVIGSTIFATLGLGLIIPYATNVPWLHDNFVRGSNIIHTAPTGTPQ